MNNSDDILILVEGQSDQKFFAKLLEAKNVKSKGKLEFFVDLPSKTEKKAKIQYCEGKENISLNFIERKHSNKNKILVICDADDEFEKTSKKLDALKQELNEKLNIHLEYYLICKKNHQYGTLENILIDYLNENLIENSKKLAEDLGGITCKDDTWQRIFSDITANQDITNNKIVKSLTVIFTQIVKKTKSNGLFYSEEMIAKLIESNLQCGIIKNEIKQKLEQFNLE
jgi:hypothetical protein